MYLLYTIRILSTSFLLVGVVLMAPNFTSVSAQRQVLLTGVLEDQGDPERWNTLIRPAIQELRERHPDLDIQMNYTTYPYNEMRQKLISAVENQTEIDLITLDQIWLGEFAEKGFLTDLTNFSKSWGRQNDWYQESWDGGFYKDKMYAIWAWTDIRGLWYWKDMLHQAGVDPNSLKTWDGYIQAAKKLNAVLRPQGIEGIHLTGASHSPDMWYPYLWMLGGDIVKQKSGHPVKGTYWFPTYNSTEGVKALEFLRDQVKAGIKPQINHFWGQEFADKKFAVMLEGSWLLGHFPTNEWKGLDKKIGMIPMFPVPKEGDTSATMMGGWMLGIPTTSSNKALSWELLTIMLQPDVLAPMLQKYGYLPTQKPIAEGAYSASLNSTIPYYKQLISMINIGHSRPSIAEYPQIADNIKQAIDEVYLGVKEPKQALDDAAKKSAEVLGWS